MTNPNQTISV